MSRKQPASYYVRVSFPAGLYNKIIDYALHNDISFNDSVRKMTLHYVTKVAYTNTMDKDGTLINE